VLHAALGPSRSIVNVGAGAGSYEPTRGRVVAVEPSAAMVAQRPPEAAPAVRALAERLPFADGRFDAALAVLTVHHWADRPAGLRELRRVARHRVVLLTYDPSRHATFWLVARYLPAIHALDRPRFPSMAELVEALGPLEVTALPIAGDCCDGFLGAFWRRPEAYLDPAVRQGMSVFGQLPPERTASGLAWLADDLASGEWDRRYGQLRGRDHCDLGYRVVVARRG
jgi:SAM-dependent methyltransferase